MIRLPPQAVRSGRSTRRAWVRRGRRGRGARTWRGGRPTRCRLRWSGRRAVSSSARPMVRPASSSRSRAVRTSSSTCPRRRGARSTARCSNTRTRCWPRARARRRRRQRRGATTVPRGAAFGVLRGVRSACGARGRRGRLPRGRRRTARVRVGGGRRARGGGSAAPRWQATALDGSHTQAGRRDAPRPQGATGLPVLRLLDRRRRFVRVTRIICELA